MSKSHRKWLIAASALIMCSVSFICACSEALQVTYATVDAPQIKSPMRFAVITDLHSSAYGTNMHQLIKAINQENPDAVLLIGDIFDARLDNQNSWILVTKLSERYPCFYVTGNHEIRNHFLEDVLYRLESLNVTVLRGDVIPLTIGESTVNICGIDDPSVGKGSSEQMRKISKEIHEAEHYSILLSHRPELIDEYSASGADLVIAGHAHGGQVKLPLIAPNGLYAPNQGNMPKYTCGIHDFETWKLLVSRGLDKRSVNAPRVFNRPELIILNIT